MKRLTVCYMTSDFEEECSLVLANTSFLSNVDTGAVVSRAFREYTEERTEKRDVAIIKKIVKEVADLAGLGEPDFFGEDEITGYVTFNWK